MSDSRTEDEAAIKAVLDDAYKAWDVNDADAFVSDYTEDAIAIMPGSFRDSREAVRQGMAQSFEGPLKGSSTYNKVHSIRFLGDDGAIVVSESGILFGDETEVPEPRRVNATWVLEKRDGRWLIASYHNSPKQAPPR